MLAGKNYIASSKVTGKQVNKNDIMTGESITVEGTSLPICSRQNCLEPENRAIRIRWMWPPEKFAGVSETGNIGVKMDTPVAAWGGKTLRDLGVDVEKPVQTVFIMKQVEQIMYISI